LAGEVDALARLAAPTWKGPRVDALSARYVSAIATPEVTDLDLRD